MPHTCNIALSPRCCDSSNSCSSLLISWLSKLTCCCNTRRCRGQSKIAAGEQASMSNMKSYNLCCTCMKHNATRACSGVNCRFIMLLSSSNSSASSSTFSCCQCSNNLRKKVVRVQHHIAAFLSSCPALHALRTARMLEHQIHRFKSRHADNGLRLQGCSWRAEETSELDNLENGMGLDHLIAKMI